MITNIVQVAVVEGICTVKNVQLQAVVLINCNKITLLVFLLLLQVLFEREKEKKNQALSPLKLDQVF